MQIMRFSTDTSFFGYAALLVFLACPLSVLGQTDLTPYQSNCQNGTTGVIELPNNSGFIMAVTDSTFVRYPEGSIGLVPGALRLNAPLADFYHEYILDNTLYLVHGGGGVVLAYDGQNFDRIDRSFLHQNQYRGTPFVYQGSLYLFGGNGLFSSKNFVTRYDFEAREWYLQKTQGSIPALGFNHIYQGLIVGESFYISSSANTDASEKDKAKLNSRIEELQNRIAEIEEKKRAISQAMLTKTGHVYIISNVGSFGENIFKIGMTRRLEPMDRVKELGDASVPFPFDVHAMIRTSDAPRLENALHDHFDYRRLNLENQRKEFFNVSIDEIKEELLGLKETLGIDSELRLTLLAEAKEYRMSQAKRKHLEESYSANKNNLGS